MTLFEVRRNLRIIAILTGNTVPAKGERLVFANNEYEVIAVKRFFDKEDTEVEMPQVHVNHVRICEADVPN